jgi:RNA:NAD 2'-phosphotransferase (TPT1/KptA family)
MRHFDFPRPDETKEYSLFEKELESDPLVLFHATAKKNLESIIAEGFKARPPLESVSYAKSRIEEDAVVIAVRFDTLNQKGIKENHSDIHVYKSEIQPDIIGYCVVPTTYEHK